MQASEKALAFAAQREACVLSAHLDTTRLAYGFGWNKPGLKEGDFTTWEEAIAHHAENAAVYEADVDRVFGAAPLTQQQYDAIWIATLNIGGTQLRKEADLIAAVIAHTLSPDNKHLRDWAAYYLTRIRFDPDKGPHNFSRRCREALVYIMADYGDLQKVKFWDVGKNPRVDSPELRDMPVFRT